MTCYVQNCKFGDVINCLPILYAKYKETGQKQTLMVSERFASVLSGCSYIQPEIWQGRWTDLKGALVRAKERFGSFVQLSTFGEGHVIPKKCPSFAIEQYRMGGVESRYGDMPLIFDQRSAEREAALVQKHVPPGKPFILIADTSESSPFAQADELYKLIVDNFGVTCNLIRLSEVRAEKIYDLLGLYDKAVAVVSVETVHLHLSAASGVPVIALVTDKPEMWHGTGWRKQFLAHIRYGDFTARQPEIVEAITRALQLRDRPEMVITGARGYNLSSLEWNGVRVGTYRFHPDSKFWRTQLAMWDGKRAVNVIPPPEFHTSSVEDGRLFVHRDKLHISFTVSRAPRETFHSTVHYGELVPEASGWRIIHHYQPKFGKNDWSSMEKNWSFFSHGGRLFAAYQRSPQQIIIEIEGDRVIRQFQSKTPEWAWGQMRGGTSPIAHNGLWLQFFHTLRRNRKSLWWWQYYTGALLMESTPPFTIVSVSKFPVLIGDERYLPDWKSWKPRVVIPYGAIKTSDGFSVSVGINDSYTANVNLKELDLNL